MIDRRIFNKAIGLGTAAAAVSLTGLQGVSSAATGSGCGTAATAPTVPVITPGTNTTFPTLKQIDAGLLNVGYAELGPANGPVVILLHGWPYDIHSYVDVAPLLAAEGYRVLVPYLRGYGTTSFLSARTYRNGQQSAIAVDIIAFMDALRIDKAVFGGFDWGSRTADIIAVLWPERVKALVSVSGYLITNRATQLEPAPPATEHTWWYEYYFATPRGAKATESTTLRVEMAQYVWSLVSPTWDFDDATFQRTAAAFANPDYPAIVLDNYRWRLSLVHGEPRYKHFEDALAKTPAISVPTITIDPALDPFTAPGNGVSYRAHFTGAYDHRTLSVGHDLPQEAPTDFAQAIVDVDHF